MRKLAILAVLFFCLSGCASTNGYLAKHAIADPAEGISVPHPVEIEKSGVKAFTTFTAVMSPDLWTEAVVGGGVYPILGCAKTEKNLLRGYCFIADVNWWGDFLLQCVFAKGKTELSDAKFVVFNRDANWAYKLDGSEAREVQEKEDKKVLEYNSSKLESDEEYQQEFFEKFGTTLKQSDEFFRSYFMDKGLEPSADLTSVKEIVVGSSEWETYKAKLAARLPYNYKLNNGQVRSGHLPLEAFRMLAVDDPGFNSGSRFVKDLKIPLIALPLTGIAWPVMAGVSILSSAVVAGVDDSWSGYYGRAKVIRYQLAPSFRQITAIYKELLKRRDERNKQLENELSNR